MEQFKPNDASGPETPPETHANLEFMQRLGQIAELMDSQKIDPSVVGQVREVRAGRWQVVTKDKVVDPESGEIVSEPHVHTLEGTSFKFIPKPEVAAVDEQRFASKAAPTVIRPGRAMPKRFRDKTALIVTDQQIGYRKLGDELQPIHDEAAMDVVQQIARYVQPDKIIVLGDNVDLPNASRFENDPNFTQTTQASIDSFHNQLARYRANAQNAEIVVLEGNHDERWAKYIRKNAAEVLGVRRANAAHELAVLTLPFLLRVDELEVQYLAGWPANTHWINERIKAIHGNKVRSNGSTAAAYANSETTSTIFGHIHRMESHHRTVNEQGGGRIISAHSFGTLSRIDGVVPSFNYGRDGTGTPIQHFENWQQGLGLVFYEEGDAPYDVKSILIDTFNGHAANLDGHVFTPQTAAQLPEAS